MTIGGKIQKRRKELGLSINELAKRTGKCRSTLYRYEDGTITNIPLETIVKLSDALHVPTSWLAGYDMGEIQAMYYQLTNEQKKVVYALMESLIKSNEVKQ